MPGARALGAGSRGPGPRGRGGLRLSARRRWRALLLGATGQLGFELERVLAPLADLTVAGGPSAVGGPPFDVADAGQVSAIVERVRPDLLVNACAYTAVEAAEGDAERAHAVNARGPAHLADAAQRLGAMMVHYSTDYVFDGETKGAYRESDETRPRNVYGRSKRDGELAVGSSGAAHLTLRTSWLFAARGRNFPAAILAAARRGDRLRVVDDQTGCPTSARLLAELTGQILAQARAAERPVEWLASRSGVYHAASSGCCTWYAFAREVLGHAGLGDVAVEPVSTAEYGARAPRPARTVLDCAKLESTFGLALPDWREHLRQVGAEGHA